MENNIRVHKGSRVCFPKRLLNHDTTCPLGFPDETDDPLC